MKRRTLKSKAPAKPAVAEYKPEPRFTFRVTTHESFYLRVGDVVPFAGRDYIVTQVKESCARIVPITEGMQKKVTFKPRFAEEAVTFLAPERNTPLSISPNSELEIKHRLGSEWRSALPKITKAVLVIKTVEPARRGRGRPRKCHICRGGHPPGCCAQDGNG